MAAARALVPSKVNCLITVPATALTLTKVRRTAVPSYACAAHTTVVADVHAPLPHASDAVKEAVGVRPSVPKLSPLIVTVPLPLGTAFADAVLTTGAAENGSARTPQAAGGQRAIGAPSKLNAMRVPATALTLTAVHATEPL